MGQRTEIASPRRNCVSPWHCSAHWIVLVSVCGVLAPNRDGAHALTMTLAEGVHRALDASPAARIARLEEEKAEDEVSVMKSRFWPHASISSQAGYSNRLDEELKVLDGSGRVRRYGLSSLGSDQGWLNVELEQLVFDLAQWRRLERTELEAEVARISADQRREGISFDVLQLYVDVLQKDRLLEIERKRVRETEWLDQQAELLLQAGRCLPSEREQVAVALEEARLEEESRVDGTVDSRRAFLAAVAATEEQPGDLHLSPDALPSPAAMPDGMAEEALLAASPELRVLKLRRQMSEVEVSAARAGAYPTVGMGAEYHHYGINRYDNYDDEVSVGVDFRLPLFDGFRTRSSVASALKDVEIARLRYEAMYEDKRVRIRDLLRQLETAQGRPELARRRVRLAEKRLRLADLNLRAGRGTIADALAAREQWSLASVAEVRAEHERILLWARLQREAGRLAAGIIGAEAEDLEAGSP